MDIVIALAWGLLGWAVRVTWTYYTHSNEVEAKKGGKFKWGSFKRKYDQSWLMGFVAMIAFSLTSDYAWEQFLSQMVLGRETIYDPKINVLMGFMGIYFIEKFAKKKIE